MVENKKKKLLQGKENLFANVEATGSREGIPIEKGVVLTESFLIEHEELIQRYMEYFTAFPDLFLDMIKTSEKDFTIFCYQRIFLRALMRFKEVYITAGRATAKTFWSIVALVLQCIFIPGHKAFIVAPFKTQAAKIAKQKLEEIFQIWPLLKKEVKGWQLSDPPGNYGEYLAITL